MPYVLTSARKGRALLLTVTVIALAALVGGCGSSGTATGAASSASAKQLLEQTFHGAHKVTSGKLSVQLTIKPTGSSELTEPITVSLAGPFDYGGSGTVPQSDFTIAGSIQGHSLKLSVISTAGHGYITADGDSYPLPQATYSKLEKSFSSVSGDGSSTSAGPLSGLGLDALSWLSNPQIVGTPTVGGAPTTEITATINAVKLLQGISKLTSHASKLGISGTSGLTSELSPASIKKTAATIGHPQFTVWTGTSDHTVRKLTITDNFPLGATASAEFGGLKSVGLSLSFGYSDLNQPQTVSAPSKLLPYSDFQAKVEDLLSLLNSVSSSAGSSSLGSSTTSAGGSGSSGGPASEQKYSECIVKAKGDVTKMQQCASLL